jgi:hypothetical protein
MKPEGLKANGNSPYLGRTNKISIRTPPIAGVFPKEPPTEVGVLAVASSKRWVPQG